MPLCILGPNPGSCVQKPVTADFLKMQYNRFFSHIEQNYSPVLCLAY